MNPRLYIKDILYHFIQRRLFKFPVAILMYHSVGYNHHFFTVTPEAFKRQMDYLAKAGYNVRPLAEIVVDLNRKKTIPSRTVALTFDDGYEDNYLNAFPILSDHGFPATIFVSTGQIGTTQLVRGVELKHLSLGQIMEMAESGLVDFQPHGVSHRNLTALSREELDTEMSESKKFLERTLPGPKNIFAYPFGAADRRVQNTASQLFMAAVGTRRGYIHRGSSLFRLPRQSVDSKVSSSRFRFKI